MSGDVIASTTSHSSPLIPSPSPTESKCDSSPPPSIIPPDSSSSSSPSPSHSFPFPIDDVDAECRVCRLGGSITDPLFTPCQCKGSIRYVHESCLLQWLKLRNVTRCELCAYPFEFTPVYATGAPHQATTMDAIRVACSMIVKYTPMTIRATLILATWLICIPLITCWIWRCLFMIGTNESMITVIYHIKSMNVSQMWLDVQYGVILCIGIFFTAAILASLRELLRDEIEAEHAEQLVMMHQDGHAHGVAAVQAHIHAHDIQHAQIQVEQALQPQPVDQPHIDPVAAPAPAAAAAAPAPAPAPAAEQHDLDELDEDHSLAMWLGLTGPIRPFLFQLLSVIIFNTAYLSIALTIPLNIGRIVFWIADVSAHDVSLSLLMSTVSFLDGEWDPERPVDATPSIDPATLRSLHQRLHIQHACILAVGYMISTFVLMIWQWIFPVIDTMKSSAAQLLLGLKVFLLITAELVAFPIFLGWCIDLLTLDLLAGTMSSRYRLFLRAPMGSTMLRWFVGIVFMLHVSFFAALLRKIIKKQILIKIIRYPDDPDFQPFRELLTLPLFTHVRRLATSAILYSGLVWFCIHIPSMVVVRVFPSVTPFHVRFSDPTEMPADLLLFHFCVPLALDKLSIRSVCLTIVSTWFHVVSGALKLKDYLLPQEGEQVQAQQQPQQPIQAQQQHEQVQPEAPVQPQQEQQQAQPSSSQVQVQPVTDDTEDVIPTPSSIPSTATSTSPSTSPFPSTSTSSPVFPTRVHITSMEEKEEKYVEDVEMTDDDDDAYIADIDMETEINIATDTKTATEAETETKTETEASTSVPKIPVHNPIPALIAAHLAAQAQAQAEAQAQHAEIDTHPIQPHDDHIDHFSLRIFVLLLCMWITHIITICTCVLVPLLTGRYILASSPFPTTLVHHDIYALLIGFYLYAGIIFICVRSILYLMHHHWSHTCRVAMTWMIVIMKWIFLSIFLLGILPLLTGILFQLVIVMPIRWHSYPSSQQNVLPLYQAWAVGLIFLRVWSRLLLSGFFGDDNPWRTRLQHLQQQQWQHVNATHVMRHVIGPILWYLCITLITPYICVRMLDAGIKYARSMNGPLYGNNAAWLQTLMMIMTPIPPSSSQSQHTPLYNTSHPIHGPITWSDHWSHKHSISSTSSFHDTILFRYAFLIFVGCGVLISLLSSLVTWYRALQQTAYEQRWMVGKTLKNVNTATSASTDTTNTSTTPTTSITPTTTIVATSSSPSDTISTSSTTSPSPLPPLDERTLAWDDDMDEKHPPSHSPTLRARHILSSTN